MRTDPTGPLAYELLIDDVVVSARASNTLRSVVAPSTPGVHTLKARIYDGVDNATEVQYLNHGGVLNMVLRQLMGTAG